MANEQKETDPAPPAYTNRLIHSKSPYLLQHAHQPVDWYPWGTEAFEKARQEDKLIFLSVGYASCHWCHVMAHESFDDPLVAQVLNRLYVPVKVDREERPDIDRHYMLATQLLTGRGGWPNSVWLLPDGRPVYAGAYFPPRDRGGMPGFRSVALKITDLYATRRDELMVQADRIDTAIQRMEQAPPNECAQLTVDLLHGVIEQWQSRFDQRHGGFGDAPKFPPHNLFRFLFVEPGNLMDGAHRQMVLETLTAMAAGGIYDHVGGGFHRYAVDDEWRIPHFEKMLYDNVLLIRAYAEGYRLRADERYREVIHETVEWLERDLKSIDGAWYSSLDADSPGGEGRYYLWSYDRLKKRLDDRALDLLERHFHVAPGGNVLDEASGQPAGLNILHREYPLLGWTEREQSLWERCRATLREERRMRKAPARDDKIVAAWNGLAIGGLADAGRLLDEPAWTDKARRAADFFYERWKKEGVLHRTYYDDGTAGPQGFLDDYAFQAEGWFSLYRATRENRWLKAVEALMVATHKRFHDEVNGGYRFRSADDGMEFLQSRDVFEDVLPAGNAVMASVWLSLYEEHPLPAYLERAEETLRAAAPYINLAPDQALSYLAAVSVYLRQVGDVVMSDANDLTLQWEPGLLKMQAGSTADCTLRVLIPRGSHVAASDAGASGIPLVLTASPAPGVEVVSVDYPESERLTFPDGSVMSVYSESVSVQVRIRLADRMKYTSLKMPFTLRAQICDDQQCFAPQSFDVPLTLNVIP